MPALFAQPLPLARGRRLLAALLFSLLPALPYADDPEPATATDAAAAQETKIRRRYWDDEQTKLRTLTPMRGNTIHGVVQEYWPDGKTPRAETKYVDGMIHGISKTYDEKGQLTSAVKVDQGKIVQLTKFHPNGKPEFVVDYQDGKRHGHEKYYAPSETLIRDIPFENGVKHGIQHDYFENGKLKRKLPWQRGKQHGIAETYTQNHLLIWEKSWVQGTLHGNVTSYWPVPEKQVQSRAVYENGKLVGKTKYFDKNGKLLKEE